MIHKEVRLSPYLYCLVNLKVMSSLVDTKMSVKEIEVLATFLSLDPGLTGSSMFNPEARKEVMKRCNLSAGGLGNHLRSLKKLKVVIKDPVNGILKVNPVLVPGSFEQSYNIRLKKELSGQ